MPASLTAAPVNSWIGWHVRALQHVAVPRCCIDVPPLPVGGDRLEPPSLPLHAFFLGALGIYEQLTFTLTSHNDFTASLDAVFACICAA
jgi:hypothetical protein